MKIKLVVLSLLLCLILLSSCLSVSTQTPVSVISTNESSDELWWYRLLSALSTPATIRVDLSKEGQRLTAFTLPKLSYTKDFDDLVLDGDDDRRYVAGGLVYGAILSLPAGEYYHYGNSGIMYVTSNDVERIKYDARARYYKRLRYVLETPPDLEIRHQDGVEDYAIGVGDNGSILSLALSGGSFVTANVYLNSRTVNGMGLGVYRPDVGKYSTASNLHTTPLNMVPLPKGYDVSLHVAHADDEGFSYFRIHNVPDWW